MKYKDLDLSAFEDWVDKRDDYNPLPPRYKRHKGPITSKNKFYYSLAWLSLRMEVLNHYGRKCMKCKTKSAIMQVDHIKPRYIYPELALTFDNLQVLCKPCNLAKDLTVVDYRPKKGSV